ncbi:MAG: ferritin-like domain-containing protein [Smithellaceae bacterium]|nr:ferritin-like domain-containing protein [Smithellaceae bacterium]
MEKKELIEMLNRDLADEHAAIIRYLAHAYQEGEDTVIGASLLARSREEMWHLHWLGMIICGLGGEPDLVPGPYPYDPTSQRTMLQSYIKYEEKLIPHYNKEAERVDDPHIKRVLCREAWESAIHARRFQRLLDKLDPAEAARPSGGEGELPGGFIGSLQGEISAKYSEMWQHILLSWKSQGQGLLGWQLMDQGMEKMKQLSLFTEAVAEDGPLPEFRLLPIDRSMEEPAAVMEKARADVKAAHRRHLKLKEDSEFARHGGLMMKLDLVLQQESHQADEMADWLKK